MSGDPGRKNGTTPALVLENKSPFPRKMHP
jgi:hypothetical protein